MIIVKGLRRTRSSRGLRRFWRSRGRRQQTKIVNGEKLNSTTLGLDDCRDSPIHELGREERMWVHNSVTPSTPSPTNNSVTPFPREFLGLPSVHLPA